MSKSAGIETLVSIFCQIREKSFVIEQGIPAKKFKQECLSPSVKPECYNLFARYRNGTLIKLADEEPLNEQIQQCESLYVLRQGTDIVSTLTTNLRPKEGYVPYSWIYDVPDDIMETKVTEADAFRLEKAIDKIWGKLFLSLDFTTAKLELEVHDTERVLTEPVSLLIRWQQMNPSKATFRELLKELIELEEFKKEPIEWEIIRKVIEGKKKIIQQTANSQSFKASCTAKQSASNDQKKKSAGIEASVAVYHETSNKYITIAQQLTVENFKKEYIWPTPDTDPYEVWVQNYDGSAEVLSNKQELDEQLQQCQGLLILPKENVDAHFKGDNLVTVPNPSYAWVDELSDKIMDLKIKERDAVFIPASLKEVLPGLMLILEFSKSEVELAIHDSKQNCIPGISSEINLIRKWLQKDPKRATFGTLLTEMKSYEEVNPGKIEWNMMKRIVEKAAQKMEQTSY